MSSFEFVIPIKKDDLLETQPGQYHVEDIVQPRLLLSQLQDAARAYNNEGIEFILEHFSTYFSIIVHGNKLDWNVINKGFDHIIRAAKNLCNNLETVLEDNVNDPDLRRKNLNIVKMTMYLFTQIMKTKDTKLAADNSTKLTLGKKKKASDNDEFCGWTEADKLAALVTLHLVVQQPLPKLWDPPIAEDSFVSMITEPCYRALEEQIIKNKTARETIFQVLGVLIKKYNHGPFCLIKLVQVLQMVEHSVSPICAGVVQLTKEFGLGTFGPQMVREIAEALATSDEEITAAEVGGKAKNCGTFLLELTKELPKEMTTAITTLQHYLETDESYTLRISVLGMMCEALNVELTGEELTEQQRELRDDFLDDLLEHIQDLSAYVRTKVLQFWSRLQRENCVPVSRQKAVLERAIQRLKDKAALVRKAAIQLVKVFIECNPFSAQLKLNVLEEQLESETKILTDLRKKIDPGPDPSLVKKWDEIEPEVISTIQKNIDVATQDEEELSQASLANLYDAIRKLLHNKDYHKAYLIVKHAERQYPDAKLLRCDMEKSDQIDYFVALLRNIFIIADRGDGMSFTQQCEKELALYKRLEEKENVVAFLEESVCFCRMISEAMPQLNALLMSKQAGDVIEAIDFFTAAHHFNMECAKGGVAAMLLLVWSPDQDKREAVERAYREMYLECENKAERARAFTVAKKLVSLVQHIDFGSAKALEHLMAKWIEKGDITPANIQVFWEMFLKKIDGTTDSDSMGALSLLVMVSNAKPSVALANLEVIQQHGLTGTCNTRTMSAQLLLSLAKKNQRYPADHTIFTSLHESLMETFSKLRYFTSFASKSIDLIYAICDTPEIISAKILADMYKVIEGTMTIENEEDGNDEKSLPVELLTRFIFVLGHVALQQLIYLDVSVYSELRRRNQVREEYALEEKKKKKKAGAFATPKRGGRVNDLRRQTLMDISNASASSRTRRSTSVASKDPSVDTTAEDDGGLEGAVADDADAEHVRAVCERDIVGAGAALARYLPLLSHLLTGAARAQPRLYSAAALTLARFMLVSSSLCEESLQLMVTVLTRSGSVPIRVNLTIAFADLTLRFPNLTQPWTTHIYQIYIRINLTVAFPILTLRFPNLTQPWTTHIYQILRDEELEVRQCAVMMFSFLVLHEMVRVKGQIADMALCCVDPNQKVATMTKQFFRKLSQKGNALYNVMPDIISRLSDPELNLPEDQYRAIMKYITSLIQKDRHMEALIEKLCQRFKLATEERQWRDLAFCLTLYSYNERSLRKLIENIDCYKDKLHCAEVMTCFTTLMNNMSKHAKNEIKILVTELGKKIEDSFTVKDDEEEGGGDAAPRPQPTPRATPRRKPAQRRNRRRSSSSPDENDAQSAEMTPTRKSNRRVAAKQNKVISDDSDEEESQKDDEVFKKPPARTTRRRK